MPKDKKKWHGVGTSPADCIFNYGLVVKYIPTEDKWKCINFGGEAYHISTISEQQLHQPFIDGWAKDELQEFLNRCAATWDEWVKLPFFHKAHDFIAFYGAYELFGTDYTGGISAREVCEELGIKYKEEYARKSPETPFASGRLSISQVEKELNRLRTSIRRKIIKLIQNTGNTEIELRQDEIGKPTYIYHTGSSGKHYRSRVFAVGIIDGKLNFTYTNDEYNSVMYEKSSEYAMRSPETLINIYYNLCQQLSIDPEKL